MNDQNTDVSDMSDADADVDAWGTTEFRPGSDVGLVSHHTVGLVARDNPSTRRRLWELVSRDAPLDDILDELSSTGLKALPDFGVVQSEGSGVRIVARGRALVDVELEGGEHHRIDASDVRTWIEQVLTDVRTVTITLPPADDDRGLDTSENDVFAVLAGSVPAAELMRRFDRADPHAARAAGGAGWTAGAHSGSGEDDVDDREDPGLGVQPEVPAGDMPDVDLEMPADVDTPDGLDTKPVLPEPPTPLSQHSPSGPGTGAAPPADPPPSVEVPPSASADFVSTGPPVDSTTESGDDGALPPSASAIFESERGGTPQTFTEDHDGMTMGCAELEALQAEAGHTEAPAGSGGERVYAVLAFSNGERVDVDRSVLIGRNPKVSRSAGGALPHIMKFDGPGQGLSRTHAEVRIEGEQLVLEDLQSTNGTEVQLPGQPRRRLRSGEPVVIAPGSLIDFGDELHCTVEFPA